MTTGVLSATPLEVSEMSGGEARGLPGGVSGLRLERGESASVSIEVPELSAKEESAPGKWRGVIGADVFGVPAGGESPVRLEALDPASGRVFAESEVVMEGTASELAWEPIASSEEDGSEVAFLFDGDPGTVWRSGGDGAGPHWAGMEFAEARRLEGVTYVPRGQRGEESSEGVVREYRIEARAAVGDWQTVAEGSADRVAVFEKREPLEVAFDMPMSVRALRFVVVSVWGDGDGASAAELVPLGAELTDPTMPSGKAWMELSPETMEMITGKRFGLRITAGGDAPLVVGPPDFCRVHAEPGGELYGRSNGGLGPDKLGAGLLGFTAMTEHGQTVLPVVTVRNGGPADEAGLEDGDMIVSVAGRPLPVNDLAPGWNWFRRSHEAVLGRQTEAALRAGRTSLALGVLREGKEVALRLPLPRSAPFTTMDPATDPEARRMLDDLIEWLEDNQRDDGSWSGDMKRTAFAGLALLATGERKHEIDVGRAIDWGMRQYEEPSAHGNLGFWSGAYMGILFAEWHLQTGDRQVLPYLEDLRDWAFEGQHTSKWEVPALGHGPSGLPYGEKALVAPACHLLVFEALARRCGMESKLWELLMPYMEMAWSDPAEGGHGALGYNRSLKDLRQFWSRTGIFAMACELRGQRPDMRDGMTAIMGERHAWFRNSHAYGEPGGGWGFLALNLADPPAYHDIIREYGWWFSLAWEPDFGLRFTQPHMGAPYMGEDDLMNVVYALVLQGPARSLHITGSGSPSG